MDFLAASDLRTPLFRIRRALLRRALMLNCACFGMAAALVFLLLEAWQLFFPLREATAGVCSGTALGLLALLFLLRHLWLLTRQPSLARLALEVEKARPEMMDAFVCALELEERQDAAGLLPLELELLSEIQGRYADDQELYQSVFRSHLSYLRPAAYLMAAVMLLLLAMRGSVPAKSAYFFRDLLTGGSSGITLLMPDGEMPTGSDARLLATVHRWQQQAEIIYLDPSDGKQRRLPMVSTPDGRFAFTFYDLAESMRFRVVTPSLRTAWRQLPVYDPPVVEAVEMTVAALPYTGRENQHFTMFSDLEMIAGEMLTIALSAPKAVRAELLFPGTAAIPRAFKLSEGGYWQLAFAPASSALLQVQLADDAGHLVEAQPFQVTVSPDLPPVVELLSPEPDSRLKLGDATRLNVFAGDDFGVKSLVLQYSINGDERQQKLLWQSGEERQPEVEYNELWDLPALQLQEGDLISAQVIALDNREPEAQASRSELFFIVIQPEMESMEADGDGGQEKQLDISDLLAESKRLLRLTWDVLNLAEEPRTRAAADLTRGVKELELEIRRRYHAIMEEAQGRLAEPLPTLFDECSLELNQAAALLERSLTEESIMPQEKCLAALVKIETELLRNAMKSKKAEEGEGDSEQGEQDQQQQQQDASSQADQARQQLEKMRDLLEKLRRLVPRQEGINEQVSQPGAILTALAARQKQLGADTANIREQLISIADAARAAATIKNAAQEMLRAENAMQAQEARTGGIHGVRARLQLLTAIRQLQDAIRKASANALAQLSEQAAQLAAAQRQAATESDEMARANQKPDSNEARQQQEKLQQLTQSLQEKMQQTADQLQDEFPEAAQAVREAGRQARNRGLPESQQRAMNALLYKRFDRAAKEQTDAANFLQELADELHAAGGKMPPVSEEDLREALQKLQEWASQANAAGKDQNQDRAQRKLEQIRQEAGPTMQEFADTLQNPVLQQVADEMNLPTGRGNPSEAGELMARQFQLAAAVLEQMLVKMTLQRKMKLHREVVTPPEKYRRQVEEYFKGLGQE